MELLAERAELRTAPTSIQTDPGNNFLKQTLPGLCVVIAAPIALLLKVIIAFNTFGTNDVALLLPIRAIFTPAWLGADLWKRHRV